MISGLGSKLHQHEKTRDLPLPYQRHTFTLFTKFIVLCIPYYDVWQCEGFVNNAKRQFYCRPCPCLCMIESLTAPSGLPGGAVRVKVSQLHPTAEVSEILAPILKNQHTNEYSLNGNFVLCLQPHLLVLNFQFTDKFIFQ